MMSFSHRISSLLLVTALVSGNFAPAARANDFGAGFIAGAIIGGAMHQIFNNKNQVQRCNTCEGRRSKPSKSDNSDDSAGHKPKERDLNKEQALASLNHQSLDSAFRYTTVKSILTKAGGSGYITIGTTSSTDGNRDLQKNIDDFITGIKNKNKDLVGGDVNLYAVDNLLDAAYNTELFQFETFANESWTKDRLKVSVLTMASIEIDNLLNGNNKGNASRSDVDAIIQKAAHQVFLRTFETDEELAMNQRLDDINRVVSEDGGMERYTPANQNEVVDAASSLFRLADIYNPLIRNPDNRSLLQALRFRSMRAGIECFEREYDRQYHPDQDDQATQAQAPAATDDGLTPVSVQTASSTSALAPAGDTVPTRGMGVERPPALEATKPAPTAPAAPVASEPTGLADPDQPTVADAEPATAAPDKQADASPPAQAGSQTPAKDAIKHEDIMHIVQREVAAATTAVELARALEKLKAAKPVDPVAVKAAEDAASAAGGKAKCLSAVKAMLLSPELRKPLPHTTKWTGTEWFPPIATTNN